MPKALFQILGLMALLLGASFAEAFLPVALNAAVPGDEPGTRVMSAREKGTLHGWQKCMANYWKQADADASPNDAFQSCQDRIASFMAADLKVHGRAFPGPNCSQTSIRTFLRSFRVTLWNASPDKIVTATQVSLYNEALDLANGLASTGDMQGWIAPGERRTLCINVGPQPLGAHANAGAFFDGPETSGFEARNIQGIILAERAHSR